MHFGNDAVHHGQAQARTLTDTFGGEEGFKNAGDVFRGDAFAGIADFDTDPIIGFLAGADADRALRFNGVPGVDQQVHEDLVEL